MMFRRCSLIFHRCPLPLGRRLGRAGWCQPSQVGHEKVLGIQNVVFSLDMQQQMSFRGAVDKILGRTAPRKSENRTLPCKRTKQNTLAGRWAGLYAGWAGWAGVVWWFGRVGFLGFDHDQKPSTTTDLSSSRTRAVHRAEGARTGPGILLSVFSIRSKSRQVQ